VAARGALLRERGAGRGGRRRASELPAERGPRRRGGGERPWISWRRSRRVAGGRGGVGLGESARHRAGKNWGDGELDVDSERLEVLVEGGGEEQGREGEEVAGPRGGAPAVEEDRGGRAPVEGHVHHGGCPGGGGGGG